MLKTDSQEVNPETVVATAENGGWRLVQLPSGPNNSWINVRLYRAITGYRRRWWNLGWNVHEHRMAKSSEAENLEKKHPDAREWVIEVLSAQEAK